MQTELDLIRRNTNHGGQPLGDLLWWELAAASVNRPDLVKLWVQGGLPTELLPEEPTAEKAFKTAARETQVGHPDRLFRVAMENEQEIVIGIVGEERDGTGGLLYHQEARITLDRQSDTLQSDQPGNSLVQKLFARFGELKTLHTTDDIRRTITRTLDSFAAVTLRHMGGVYWVPAPYAAALRQLQGVIEKLGESKMYLVPITATKEGQAALAQAAKASIEEELTALQTEMQQFLQTPPDRASTLMRRLEHFDDLRRRASLYQTVLQAQVEGLAENLTTGKLPESEVAFVDEIFKASSAILNTLLTIANERVFHNGGQPVPCPLVTLFAASNELPEGQELEALFDRFLIRFHLGYMVREISFRTVVTGAEPAIQTQLDLTALQQAQWAAQQVKVPDATYDAIIAIRDACRTDGIVANCVEDGVADALFAERT